MSTEIKQNNWYVLRVMGGKEKTAEAIEKEIEINSMSKFVSKFLFQLKRLQLGTVKKLVRTEISFRVTY